LAIKRWSWRENRQRTLTTVPAQRRYWRGAERIAVRYSGRHVIFEYHHVFHHPFDRRDIVQSRKKHINTAADAAQALRPLAGNGATLLFALGIIGVGFLAVPVMTTGAAYDLAQTMGWKHGLSVLPREAKKFYGAIVAFTIMAVGVNLIGLNPMKLLVFSGLFKDFQLLPWYFLIMLMTNKRTIMGDQVNSAAINVLDWVTTGFIFAATLGLVITWFI
jgi:Mn2+/Fe2+ NRAMP family transporter